MVLIVRFFFIPLTVLFLSSCQIGYLIKSGYSHLSMLNQKVPVSKALGSDKLSTEQKKKLLLAEEVKKFTIEKLGFKQTKNYSDFVDLGRPYITYSVMASEKWKFKPYLWDFPIIGKAPYKGFYNEADAQEEAAEFEKKGFDVYVRGVTAYSTLGKLNDPILSSMLSYSDHAFVNTIIHELVHTTLFIKDNIDFNERLAVFVANKGTALFYLEKEGENSSTLQQIKNENHDDRLFSEFITTEINDLKNWYEQQTSVTKTEDLRQMRFELIKSRFAASVSPKLKSNNYKNFTKQKLNNARLSLYNTYDKDQSDFETVFIKTSSSISMFIQRCKKLNDVDNPELELKRWAMEP